MIETDEQNRSPFRAAVESKDFSRIAATLADDVVFRSPVVFKPYEGREAVSTLLHAVGAVLGPTIAYRWQVREGDREVLCFTARVGERDLDGVDLLRYDADGRVAELVVMMRPASGLAAAAAAIAETIQAAQPASP